MRNFLVIVLLPIAAQARNLAQTESCAELNTNEAIVSCLNTQGKKLLAAGSEADRIFNERLNRFLAKYDLATQNIKTKSLESSFSILLESHEAKSDRPCFDFASSWTSGRRKQVGLVQAQMREAALFLAEIHARSWGHQVSLLFPIKEVSICSYHSLKRAVSFEQRSLQLGLSKAPLKAFEIMEAWNSGNPVRSSHLSWYNAIPFLGKKLREWSAKDNPEQLLRDKIAENWLVLNPTGSLRTTALYTLAESVIKMKSLLGNEDTDTLSAAQKKQLLLDIVRGPGFSSADVEKVVQANEADSRGLYNLWRQKLFSPQNILNVMENAIGDQARQNANLHLVLRQINAGVAVVNDKNIIVRIEQLMANSIPVSSFDENASKKMDIEVEKTKSVTTKSGESRTVTTKIRTSGVNPRDITVNADEMNAGVAINLIDNVVVSVQLPSISPTTYRRVCLFQALQEYIPADQVQTPH